MGETTGARFLSPGDQEEVLQYITRYLEGFGCPDEIAAACRVAGVKGLPGRCCRCALANLIMRRFRIPVSITGFLWYQPHTFQDDTLFWPLPPAAIVFANQFDDRQYLDLIGSVDDPQYP